jgi:enoyl-CoA hydratase/carnithine racemase
MVTHAAAVATVTLNRPEKKNALSGGMYTALTAALRASERNDEVRAILLRGAGGNFTAGNDMPSHICSPHSLTLRIHSGQAPSPAWHEM